MKLSIIDFDQTLFFTKEALFDAYKYAFETKNIELTKEIFDSMQGKQFSDISNYINTSKEILDEVHYIKTIIYPTKYLDLIKPNYILINKLKKNNIKNSDNIDIICTLTTKKNVEYLLKVFYTRTDYNPYYIIDNDCLSYFNRDKEKYFKYLKYTTYNLHSNENYIYDDLEENLQKAKNVFETQAKYIKVSNENNMYRWD
jgi:hypothetical protein